MERYLSDRDIPGIISKVISINYPLRDTPSVAVWLTGLSATTGAAVSIHVTATNITNTQFTLHIDSNAGDHLLSVGTAWALWQADEKLTVGSQNKMDIGITHAVWTLQHTAFSSMKLVLQPQKFVRLDAPMMEYHFDEKKMWHYHLTLG